jgi:hypothetical protein
MDNINIWSVNKNIINKVKKELVEKNHIGYRKHTYLLNTKKDEYSYTELYLKNLANYYINKIKTEPNDEYTIEFWYKEIMADKNGLHTDVDEYRRDITEKVIFPELSCVSYLDDNEFIPTIITDIDFDCFKYKKYSNENKVLINFPKNGTIITFDGSKYHGSLCIDDLQEMTSRKILVMNIWKNYIPKNLTYFKSNIKISSKNLDEELKIENITNINNIDLDDDKTLNWINFENYLYNHINCGFIEMINNELVKEEEKKISENDDDNNDTSVKMRTTYLFRYNKELSEKKRFKTLLDSNNLDDDIKLMQSIGLKENYKLNRFFQRFTKQGFLSEEICNWICADIECVTKEIGWQTKRHSKYPTTDNEIMLFPNIYKYMLQRMIELNIFIKDKYMINDDYNLNFKDIFIVKYECENDKQKSLELHIDHAIISGQILLNDNFEGGGTYFNDGLIVKPKKGDFLLHSSQIKHAGLPITKGKRYIIVFFIDLEKNK